MLGIVVGLAAEARLARGLGGLVEIGGGLDGGLAAAERLVGRGVCGLLSFGLAGGLSPEMEAGAIVVPAAVLSDDGRWAADPALAALLGTPAGILLAASGIIATRAAKQAAWQRTGAMAVDMESGAVARVAAQRRLPFAVLRAVCDPAGRDLPPAALTAVDAAGRIKAAALAASLARHPGQVAGLVALAREAGRARQALLARVRTVGPLTAASAGLLDR